MEYFQLVELKGLPINVVQTVGHTQVRRIVLGEADRRPTEEELERMRRLLDDMERKRDLAQLLDLAKEAATYIKKQKCFEWRCIDQNLLNA